MSFILPHLAPSVFTVPANQRVAVYSLGPFTVSRSEKPNTFSVQQSAGHTVVGSLNVASGQAQRFCTRKTAANTFVSYRI